MGATAAFRVGFAVVALLALTAVPAHSSDGRVITTSLAIDPQATTTVYAGTYGGGVFKSMDGGASWSPTGLTNIYVLSLAIDPQSPTTLYAGEDGGAVYKSTDGGATWNRIVLNPLSSGPCGPCGGVLALAIDPLIPTTIFGGTDVIYTQSEDGFLYTVPGAVYKTTDVGATFSIVYSGPTVSMSSLAIAPRTAAETPLTLYAGHTVSPWWVNSADVLNSGGVLKSMDGGASWDVTGLTDIDSVWALAIDPRTPTTLYAGEYGGAVFKSTDGGASWNAIGLTGVGVSALAIDPLTPTTVYAGSDGSRSGGVFKSTDGGISWNAIGLVATGRVSALAIDSSAPTTVYAATDGGVYKSTNGGASWDATGLIHWLHLSSVSLNPTRVAPGGASTGTVTLNAPAPAGGAIVTLYSDAVWLRSQPASRWRTELRALISWSPLAR